MSDTKNEKMKSSQSDPTSSKISKTKKPKVDGSGSQKKRTTKPSSSKKAATKKSSAAKKPNAEFGDRLVDKLKKGLLQAYEVGAKVVDELSQTAQEYTEKYKTESEIKKMKGKRDLLITELGHYILKRHLTEGKVSESFFNEKEIIDQFKEINMLDKQIINAGKQLDNAKKNNTKTV